MSYWQKLRPSSSDAEKYFLKANEALVLDAFNDNASQTVSSLAISTILTPAQVKESIGGLRARNLVKSSRQSNICQATKIGKNAAKKLHRKSGDIIVVDQF